MCSVKDVHDDDDDDDDDDDNDGTRNFHGVSLVVITVLFASRRSRSVKFKHLSAQLPTDAHLRPNENFPRS